MSDVFIEVEKVQSVDIVLSRETARVNDPGLQSIWDGSTEPAKNTFVDANQAEITTFLDILPTIELTAEGGVAIDNIQSNGGVLTDKEKYFVNRWVSRMVTNGDWALLDDLAYAGFADDSCKLTKWISGDLMTNNGAALDGQNWVFDGNSYIDSNYNPSQGTNKWTLSNSLMGIYVDYDDLKRQLPYNLCGAGTTLARGSYIYNRSAIRWDAACNVSSASNFNDSTYGFSKNMMIVSNEVGGQAGYKNGVLNRVAPVLPTEIHNGTLFIGAYSDDGVAISHSTSKISLFVVGAGIGFGQFDFYEGFEDFRTSLHPEILYNIPQSTGQTTVYRTGDDADIEAKLMLHYRKAQAHWNGTAPRLADFWTLHETTPNIFGNTSRFTNEQGDYVDVYNNIYYLADGTVATSAIYTTNEYMIDNYTGDGISLKPSEPWNAITLDWNAGIDWGIDGASIAGFTDFFVANQKQIQSLEPMELRAPLGGSENTYITWRPFNLFSAYIFNNTTTSSTTAPNSTTSSIGYANPHDPLSTNTLKTYLKQYMKVRKHF